MTRAVAEQHRRQVIGVAAKLFGEHGIDGVSLQRIAAEAGLTPGFFGRHFVSKEELVAAAVERAFDDALERTDHCFVTGGVVRCAGCPVTAFAVSAFHAPSDSSVRRAFKAGLARVLSRTDAGGRDDLLAVMAGCVGAAVITRATGGEPPAAEVPA
ncbi:TetR/AcrR family transcriptional regulator [Actinoplanes sp. HUAS TT8]|uniref:TetR/AcrR family transcriptional regulator n=1 Tax=Actinoplanes sp. HUAS TT8 TaxID=3447453 RepID=UPI003F521759